MDFQDYENRLAGILDKKDLTADQLSLILIASREYEGINQHKTDQLMIMSTILAGGMLSENVRLGDTIKTYERIATESVALAGMIKDKSEAYYKLVK